MIRLFDCGSLSAFLVLLCVSPAFAQKAALSDFIHKHDEQFWGAALQIWNWAEPGYQETKSSKLLADMLEEAGMKVERGVAEIPTAFTATFGEGKPIIGILGEYDALPGLSQNAVPFRDPNPKLTYGHGCAHHVFGVASAAATLAIVEQIKAGLFGAGNPIGASSRCR